MADETHSSWKPRDFITNASEAAIILKCQLQKFSKWFNPNMCYGLRSLVMLDTYKFLNYKKIIKKLGEETALSNSYLTFMVVDIGCKTFPGFPLSLVILYSKTSSTNDVTGMKTPLEPERLLSQWIHLSLSGKYLGPGNRRATPFIICTIIYSNGWRS